MVRSAWAMPMTLVQKFEANEPVAAEQCLEIKDCEQSTGWLLGGVINSKTNAPEKDLWKHDEGPYFIGFVHGDGSCEVSFEFGETDVKFVGNRTGEVDKWVDVNNDDVVSDGDRVYWHTSEGLMLGTRYYNHWATISKSSNRS